MALKYLYVPSGYKAGTAYGVLPNDSSADFDEFARDTIATRINADGLVETMATNVPRLDYTDGSCPALLTEPESNNRVKYSEDFGQWLTTVSGTGVAPVISTGFSAPDGSSNARKIVFDKGAGSTSSDICFIKDSYPSAVDIFTQTVWMRTESGTAKVLMDFNSANSNEVVVTTTWQRMTLTKSSTFTSNKEFRIGLRGGSSTVDSATILVWGAQLEKQPYATAYIRNNGNVGGVTRSVDRANFAGNFEFNGFEGVLEARFKAVPMSIPSSRITLAADSGNRIVLGYLGGANDPVPYLLIISSLSADEDARIIMPSSFNLFDYNTYKLKFKSGNNELKINGELVDTNDDFKTHTFAFGSALRTISLNNFGTSTSRLFYGGIKHIKVYDSITDF